jgi:hypothetical protein
MYSVIAGKILNMTSVGQLTPELSCFPLVGEEEWKLLYCAAHKTRKEPKKPYTIKEALDYLGWLCGPKRAPRDGPPGVKTIMDRADEIIYAAGLLGVPRMTLRVKSSP